ncbi:MAG TPA: DUF6516 family protein [Stellaceae bacterium]
MKVERDHGLEFFLAFDGLVYVFEEDYRLKFRIRRVAISTRRPHGLSYSFTLHAPNGQRLVGFDNAHRIRARRAQQAATDHWHSAQRDTGQPYAYKDSATLIEDFLDEVERVLKSLGVKFEVIREERK